MLTEIKCFMKGLVENYDFRGFKTIRTYGNDIRNNVTTLKAANLEQTNLMAHIHDFVKNTKPQDPKQKKLKFDVLDRMRALVKGRELMYNAFRSGIFHTLEISQEGEGLKILTPNQLLKRLPIALAQVKAGNNSESLLNESDRLFILCTDQKKLLKKYTTT